MTIDIKALRDAWRLHMGDGVAEVTAESDQGTIACLDAFPRLLDALEAAERERDAAKATAKEWLTENGPGGWVDGLRKDLAAALAELEACKAKLAALVEIHPFSEWREDDGNVLWFNLPVCDPPFYVGQPDDSEWPFDNDPDGIPDVRIGWSRMPPVNADVAAAKEPTP